MSKSTKNLKNMPSKSRLLEELDVINDTLNKVELSKLRAKKNS